MAKAYNADCIVLKHTKLGETDTIVTFLASDGTQVRAVAKGLRKPGNRIGARLQLFSEVHMLLHSGRSLDIVGETRTIRPNAALRENLELTACASVIAELFEKLGRDGVQLETRMYAMCARAFEVLADTQPPRSFLVVAACIFKVMAMQGFAPAIYECAMCGRPVETIKTFDLSCGGTICDQCDVSNTGETGRYALLAPWVHTLLYSTFEEIAHIDNAPSIELLMLSYAWVQEHLMISLNSMSFLRSLI